MLPIIDFLDTESKHNAAHTVKNQIESYLMNIEVYVHDLTSGTVDVELFPYVELSIVVRGTIIARRVIDRFTRNI